MALLAAAVARRASPLIRPMAAAVSIRRMGSSSSIEALRAEAASLRAEAASYRIMADALRASCHDSELLRIIESTIKSNDRSLVEDVPSDFPFQIFKMDGLTDITLTRRLKGEQIQVLVSVPTLDQDDGSDSSSSSDGYTSYSDENDEDEDENRSKEHTVPLTVTVSKADGSSLEFACTAYPEQINIDTLSMRQPPSRSEVDEDVVDLVDKVPGLLASNEVVEFSELDENMQEALHKYLEFRGVNTENMKVLHEHMVSKDRRRRLLWLAKLSDFVKKD